MKKISTKIGWICIVVLLIAISFQHVALCAEFERHDITFRSQGLNCAGWYYVPQGLAPGEKRPAIVMAPGWSMVKEMDLDKYAEKFAEAGFAVLVFDYRYFGASEGEPRGQIFYFEQQQDYRNAITWISLQKEVDSTRIGIWGTSYSGGHVLHVGAFDKRVKAVVAQVPTTNFWETKYQNRNPKELAGLFGWWARNRVGEYTKGKVNYLPAVAPEGQRSTMPQKGAYEWFIESAKNAPNWENRVTIESLEINIENSPTSYIHLISPTPLLMITASNDILCSPEAQKRAFERAGEPKKLTVIQGGHFDAYQDSGFVEASTVAVEWFKKYLKP